jgi:hypothetical protein
MSLRAFKFSQLRQLSQLRKTTLMSPSKPQSQAPAKLQTPKKPTPVAFISGPLEVEPGRFETHYAPRIQKAIKEGHHFILGPARGTDALAFKFLKNSGVSASRIRVYLNAKEGTRIRGEFKKFEEEGGSVVTVEGGHTERDKAMTRASHYDILRYRTEEECRAFYGPRYRKRISGTEKNELRRKAGLGLVMPPTE